MKWLTAAFVALTCVCRYPLLAADESDQFFESRIRPLLVERCQECHGAEKQEGGLRLDFRAAWLVGGEHGPVIQVGSPNSSRLIEAVRYENRELQMPPTKKLSAREITDLEAWVQMGAPDPRDDQSVIVKTDKKNLWSLCPVFNAIIPRLDEENWSQQAIDCFILDKQRSASLRPSPPVDRRTLIRRATMDLKGLLPTSDEVDSFVRDTSPDAYGELLDRLLAAPQYGENWGRHWLDIARYSDTKGYVYAREENRWVHAPAYRDWVVRSLNQDLPYDQFIRLQLAADQIVPASSPELAAMGFLTIGRRFLGVTHDVIDDRIDVVTRGILGFSVACARCHDHKYDPIPTKDYYSLYGVFQSCEEQMVPCGRSTDTAFDEELAKRETKRRDTMTKRRQEQSGRVRAKIDQYLLAQLELEKYPEEVFNQVVEPGDLNPFVVRKWQAYLAMDKRSASPVFAKWHELDNQAHPDRWRSVASKYGAFFEELDRRWNEYLAVNANAIEFPDINDERFRRILYGMDSPCIVPDEHITNIEAYFPTNVIEELWKLQGEVDRWLLGNDNSPLYATILVDRPTPSTPRVFLRGNPLTKGDEVSRQFLSAMSSKEDRPFVIGSGRLELANAIVSPSNPLTSRVMVNRIWMHHFGRGLVDTPSDFGNRAELPSHPELLDWLAIRFIKSGWSIKSLHKMIMLSSTYQQGSSSASQSADPANRLLARMTSRRLTFEQIRDTWLQSSGELDHQVGGRSRSLFDQVNLRRTLYATIDREKVSPVLRMFDFANPDLSIPKRSETSVPQQALFALNHPFIAQRATRLAALGSRSNEAKWISQLYQALYQRDPTEEELRLADEFIQSDPVCGLLKTSNWTYGYGEFDPAAKRVKIFNPLPHFNGTDWQGGENYPDAKLGWLKLTSTGGHPGNDLKHAVIRRWTATEDGEYSVVSRVSHIPEVGDGIRAMICHSERGILGSATVFHSSENLNLSSIKIWKGDTLDFIVDICEGLNSDQFLWSATISKIEADSITGGSTLSDAERDFTPRHRLDRQQQLAQVLMLANEFMFVD